MSCSLRPYLLGAVVLAGLWAAALGLAPRGEPSAAPAGKAAPVAEKHYVTPRQLTASGDMARKPVGHFTAIDQDGLEITSAELSDGQPLVLVFIKTDCPCNVEFEPCFHRVERLYRGCVKFAGVIDGPAAVARRYADDNRVPYPVLADPQRRIIARFAAENGAYVALVTPDGTLDTLWPGCSAEMLRALGRRLALLAGVAERPLDCTGLPDALVTGCPFARD